eukprot:scaffold16888_cov121-Isochrysis_galbana.AAC.3
MHSCGTRCRVRLCRRSCSCVCRPSTSAPGTASPGTWRNILGYEESRHATGLLPRRPRVDRRLISREWAAPPTRAADGHPLGRRLSAAARWPSLADFGVCGGKSR